MFYVYELEYSQTDKEYILFYSHNEKPAEYIKQIKDKGCSARYFNFICKMRECANLPK